MLRERCFLVKRVAAYYKLSISINNTAMGLLAYLPADDFVDVFHDKRCEETRQVHGERHRRNGGFRQA